MKEFDLQLFVEDAGTTTPDPSNAAGAESSAEQVALVDGEVRLVRGDKLVSELVDEDDEQETNDDQKGEEEADPAAGGEGTPKVEQAHYTPDELRTTQLENIDPKRLPPELQEIYRAMQAPITRKNMELAEALKALKDLPEQIKPKEEAPRITAPEFYARQHAFLREKVAHEFGVDQTTLPESVNDWPQTMQDAYADTRAELRRAAEDAQKQQQAEVDREKTFKATANEYEAEFRTMDPDAYADLEAKLRGGELPMKDVNAIREAIAKGDKKTVSDIFEKHRTAFHAGKNGIKTGEKQTKAPAPKLENPGNGGQQEGKGAPDYAELGKCRTWDDKLAWLRKNNIKP